MEKLGITNIPLFIVFLLNAGLGLLVYSKRLLHQKVNISFSLFSWALAGWIFSIFMMFTIKEPEWRLFWGRMSFVTSSNIPSTFLYFSLIFPNEKRRISPLMIALIFFPSTIFALASFSESMVQSVHWETMDVSYGAAHKFFSVYLILTMAAGIYYLFKSFKNSIGLERIQIKYCFLGTFLTTIPAVTLNVIIPSLGTSRFSHLGPATTFIMVSFITYI